MSQVSEVREASGVPFGRLPDRESRMTFADVLEVTVIITTESLLSYSYTKVGEPLVSNWIRY